MISDARGGHVSPGIYTEEKDVTYSVKSLGITSLGLVGETLMGPAFQNIEIENWGDFVDYFGGCSPEKFKNGNLKYELPYIAKSYLEESKRLNVVRVLGLSGYYAGPAFPVKASDGKVVAILRSKMTYNAVGTGCEPNVVDTPKQLVDKIEIVAYTPKAYTSNCASKGASAGSATADKYLFGIKATLSDDSELVYNVSLRPTDNDYIYNIISSNPSTGETPFYIEAVYENSFDGTKAILAGECEPEEGKVTVMVEKSKVTEDGENYYLATDTEKTTKLENVKKINDKNGALSAYTYDKADGYTNADFAEAYRCAITPWIVSNISASETDSDKIASMKSLFRFYTISDGDASNFQVKVSIQNIDPKNGTFDVIVRDFNDTDSNIVALEKFMNCSLVEGDTSFIGYKIGTFDGGYEAKSKYITVEMADGDFTKMVPCGFLGYPMPTYGASAATAVYNTSYKPSVKSKRQYFGVSSDFDVDILKYKGAEAYIDDANETNGFHLDSILNVEGYVAYVDGVSGYSFTSVNSVQPGKATVNIPRIINADYMDSTIYSDKNLRKFTVGFYGGFDGWDIFASARTITNEYKSTNYAVSANSRYQVYNNSALDGMVSLPSTATTADYYAFLGGYKVFANPQDIDINVFSTPGINWMDHTLLFEEALDVIVDSEDGRGGDALYVVDSPIDSELDVDTVVSEFEDKFIDSSYACTYFPGVMYFDKSNSRYVNIPVTKDVVRNMAATDNNSFPWFAPAGIERGDVKCIKAMYKTTLADEDALYEVGINPVKSFAQDGVKIWGNKTLYSTESPLNRINVRRLMIRVKKLVQDAALSLIFEQYDETLEKQFKSIVEPILADVKSNRGIYDYRVITECTPETRDQHILPAKILIKPTPALEYISISFVVYPESVEFDEN